MKGLFTDRFSRNMTKLWYVSICHPYYKPELAWTASTSFDSLSADTLAKLDGYSVPIERIEADGYDDAISKFKAMHPEFKKHYNEMDAQDDELSL